MDVAAHSCFARTYWSRGWTRSWSRMGATLVPGTPNRYRTPARSRTCRKASAPIIRGMGSGPRPGSIPGDAVLPRGGEVGVAVVGVDLADVQLGQRRGQHVLEPGQGVLIGEVVEAPELGPALVALHPQVRVRHFRLDEI